MHEQRPDFVPNNRYLPRRSSADSLASKLSRERLRDRHRSRASAPDCQLSSGRRRGAAAPRRLYSGSSGIQQSYDVVAGRPGGLVASRRSHARHKGPLE
jgi:hypothetical protein